MQAFIEPLVVEENQSEVVGDPPLPPARYMYVSLSLETSFFVHVVYVSLILFIIWNWHICYFMQASSEASVLEEHQIGDPPLTSQQVRLCIAFFVGLCIAFSDLVLSLCTLLYVYVSLWHMLLYAGIYWASGAWREPKRGCFRPTSDEPTCTFMYRFLLIVIIMIQHVLFYFFEIV